MQQTSSRASRPARASDPDLAMRDFPASPLAFTVVIAIGACAGSDSSALSGAGIDDAGAGTKADAESDVSSGIDGGPSCTNDLHFAPGQENALQDAVNSLTGCANILLAPGTFR